jgi:protein CpxP
LNKINTWALALAGAATIGLGGLATAVLAADQPAPLTATQGGPERPRWDPAQMQARMAERAERRAAHLRDVLQLRQDQEPALQALMSSMRPPEGMRRGMGMMGRGGPGGMRPGGMGPDGAGADEHLTTPQRLDRMAEMMSRRQQAFQARAEAIRRFYAQLSPVQQRAFDALPPMGGHRGMGMGGRGGHRGFGHGGPGMMGHRMGGPGMDGEGPGGPPPGDDGQ